MFRAGGATNVRAVEVEKWKAKKYVNSITGEIEDNLIYNNHTGEEYWGRYEGIEKHQAVELGIQCSRILWMKSIQQNNTDRRNIMSS